VAKSKLLISKMGVETGEFFQFRPAFLKFVY